MKKARRATARVSGELLHRLLGLVETVEVLDVTIELRGDGLPDSCVVPEGGATGPIDLNEVI